MDIRLALSQSKELGSALDDIFAQLGSEAPSLLLVAFNSEFAGEAISVALAGRYSCPAIGGSSCGGALGVSGNDSLTDATLAVFAIWDAAGHYGVGHSEVHDDPYSGGQKALDMALYASGRGYESPALIWCILPPGQEERVLDGMRDVVGPLVPVLGGSSADNDVAGAWQQITDLHACGDQVAVAVLYPSRPLSVFFSSGYRSSGVAVTVTAARGREIVSLDDQPAAAYYNQLTGGSIASSLSGGDILSSTTMMPLGRKIPSPAAVDEFVLSHPHQVTESGGLSLFSEVPAGQAVHIMQTSRDNLVARAERVVFSAINLLPEGRQPAGVLLIYCAGCMLAVDERIDEVAQSLRARFPELPILGWFTFGEQGCFLDGVSRHGNLMISAAVFSQ